jgi:hypothetical protein
MPYIRVKKISNKPYAYLVESISTPKGPRQKVKKYLGRVFQVKKNQEITNSIEGKTKKEFLQNLIIKHLQNHGFRSNKGTLVRNKLIFKDLRFNKGVLTINDGHLCNFTIDRILNFKKFNDVEKDGKILAKRFLTAGLLLSQEEFVSFYQLL